MKNTVHNTIHEFIRSFYIYGKRAQIDDWEKKK